MTTPLQPLRSEPSGRAFVARVGLWLLASIALHWATLSLPAPRPRAPLPPSVLVVLSADPPVREPLPTLPPAPRQEDAPDGSPLDAEPPALAEPAQARADVEATPMEGDARAEGDIEVEPTQAPERAAPYLLASRIAAHPLSAPVEDAPLVAEHAAASRHEGEVKEDQRGASLLFNPELREVFPDNSSRPGGEDAGHDDSLEESAAQKPGPEAELMAARVRDMLPSDIPRTTAVSPNRRTPDNASRPQGGVRRERIPREGRGAETRGGDGRHDAPVDDAATAGGDARPAQTDPTTDEGKQRRTAPQDGKDDPEQPLKRKGAQLPNELPRPTRVAAVAHLHAPREPSQNPVTSAALAKPPQSSKLDRPAEARTSTGHAQPPSEASPAKPSAAAAAKRAAVDALSPDVLSSERSPERPVPLAPVWAPHWVKPQTGAAASPQSPADSSGDGASQPQSSAVQGPSPQDALASPEHRADDPDGAVIKEQRRPPARAPRMSDDNSKLPAIMDGAPHGAAAERRKIEVAQDYDRVALLMAFKASAPDEEQGAPAPTNKGGAPELREVVSQVSSPLPGGGSRAPMDTDGPGGTADDGASAIRLSPDVLRRLSDQSGQQITSLHADAFLDVSTQESPYWAYYRHAGSRVERAWERHNRSHPYFNIDNDAAWAQLVVVIDRRGHIQALEFIRRSGTSLDDVLERCVTESRFRRFPRGYPDTLVMKFTLTTTGH